MNYVGVDIHKRYSVLVAVDERGRELGRSRINGNTAFGFAQFFLGLEGKSKVVLEACWNWGRIYDLLSEIEQVEEVVLAHPLKTRLIADAQIKTDALDAHALATLLRGDLIARAHVPAKPTRQRKEVLRQRLYWARLRTRVRNRIHALIDRQRELSMPQCSDLFGRKGLSALTKLVLSEPDATLLREDLELLGLIQQQIKAQEARIVEFNHTDETTLRLQTIPGMGKILAAVAARPRSIACSASALQPNCAPMPGWFRGPTPVAAEFIKAPWSRAVTNGCNGLSSKRPGWRLAARLASVGFTANTVPEARMPMSPLPASPDACAKSALHCSKKGEIFTKLSPVAPLLD
jgi:transposase